MATDSFYPDATSEPPAAIRPGERLARAGGTWALLLTLVALICLVESLQAAAWSEELGIVRVAVLGGAVVGALLAMTRWDSAFAAFYGVLFSVAWITTFLARGFYPELSLHDGIQALVQRNLDWFTALVTGSPSTDNLIFVTQLCIFGWWLGFSATWSVVRHRQVLRAVVPMGIALLINLYYAPLDLSGYLIAFLLVVLMLAIRVELARNEAHWQVAHIRYMPDLYLDFLKAGVLMSVVAIGAAWVLPDAASRVSIEKALRPFEQPWHRVEDTWSRMYRSLNYPTSTDVVTSFSKSVTLGGPVSLTDRPILEAESPQRTYWRAAIYDDYTGRGWLNTDQETVNLSENQLLGEPLFNMQGEITATIRTLENGQETIFGPPQPLWVSVPVEVTRSQSTEAGEGRSVSMIRARTRLGPSSSYQVVSAITQATPELLRADPKDYPSWITRRYLQLPPDLPSNVRDFAEKATAGYDNAFDKATALEARLREYPYNQQIQAPPVGTDAVAYFLFGVQQGYCDYYASAMAVLLRAVGIPSRFVVGYTPGEYVEPNPNDPVGVGKYRVLERNSHAWVEAFFPSYGWVQFEPTASEPLLTRPVARLDAEAQGGPTPEPDEDLSQLGDLRGSNLPPMSPDIVRVTPLTWIRQRAVVLALGMIALLGAAAWGLTARRRAAFTKDPQVIARLFAAFGAWAARLGIAWAESSTPWERAVGFGKRLPEAAPHIMLVARLFVAERYGRQAASDESVAESATGWRRLQPIFWRRWLEHLLGGRRGA